MFDVNIGAVTIVKVIFPLLELVEQRIATEAENTQGALISDGLSCNDMHFVAIILSYCSIVQVREEDKIHSKFQPRLALLAISSTGQVFLTDNEKQTSEGESNHLQL